MATTAAKLYCAARESFPCPSRVHAERRERLRFRGRGQAAATSGGATEQPANSHPRSRRPCYPSEAHLARQIQWLLWRRFPARPKLPRAFVCAQFAPAEYPRFRVSNSRARDFLRAAARFPAREGACSACERKNGLRVGRIFGEDSFIQALCRASADPEVRCAGPNPIAALPLLR